ncbi:MAG: maleylpyruvate isomerase family mycothiol-dependent enzyme [Actinobacteria bacterium]|nr:maleylpyruvate isomerase family mycothiol-dependent enzyme [Actinomycetota bacterium]
MNAPGDIAPDLSTLARLQEAFASTIPHVDPATPVPWCGDWSVADLVEHLAQVHHWAAGQAVRREVALVVWSADDSVGGYRRAADEALTTLSATPPDAPAWTLDLSERAGFWHRRQVHETLVHLWDLRTAGGLPLDQPAALWADTVDEVVSVMAPRQVRLGRTTWPARTVALICDDADATWTLPATDAGSPAVTVRGPAASLALLLWGRIGPGDATLHVVGDHEALLDALGRDLTP